MPQRELTWEQAIDMGEGIAREGGTVYFKFTCERCGERCTFNDPNTLYRHGECAKCGHENRDIQAFGMIVTFDLVGGQELQDRIQQLADLNPLNHEPPVI